MLPVPRERQAVAVLPAVRVPLRVKVAQDACGGFSAVRRHRAATPAISDVVRAREVRVRDVDIRRGPCAGEDRQNIAHGPCVVPAA